MKAVVSRRVLLPKSKVDGSSIRKDLVITDTRTEAFGRRQDMICFEERQNYFLVPKAYGLKLLKDSNIEFDDTQSPGDPIEVSFKGTLRPGQDSAVETTLKSLRETEGGVMHLYCGFGKTTCANMISCHMRLKTLILVHTTALLEQWEQRIEQFVEGASVGRIRQKEFDVEGRTHVIGLMQSISKRSFEKGSFKCFGLLIVDEAHHVCAQTLSKCIEVAGCKYRLGLSATPHRKDGFTPFLFHSIGPICCSVDRNFDTQSIEIMNIRITDGPQEIHTMRIAGGKTTVNVAKMINDLCDPSVALARSACIVKCIKNCFEEGRQTMVLSDRRAHLNQLESDISENSNISTGFMVGGMKKEDLKRSESCRVIFATYAYCSEGVDVASLDTVLFATPRSDVVQCTGRILRLHGDKKTPRVVDVVDGSTVFTNQSFKRRRYYNTLGAVIKYFGQDLCLIKSLKRKKVCYDDSKGEGRLDESRLSHEESFMFEGF